MKIRSGFVTNSSSSSYIICFARIEDKEKANPIMEKYKLHTYTAEDIKNEMWCGELGCDWAGAICYDAPSVIKKYPDDKFVLLEDWIDADWDDETDEYIFYYDFSCNNAIEEITKENGFANIEVAEGEGFNG